MVELSSLLECTSATTRLRRLYDWWTPLKPSSKTFKGTRTSCTCQNMHFSDSARGEYRGLHAEPHQWEWSLGMRLHVWSNIRPSFNQPSCQPHAPPPTEDRQRISGHSPRVTAGSKSGESLACQSRRGPEPQTQLCLSSSQHHRDPSPG